MKKLLSIFLVLILSFSLLCFISCDDNDNDDNEEYDLELDTPAVAVAKAVNKTSELDSYLAMVAMEIEIYSSFMGMPITTTIPVTVDIKLSGANSESPRLFVDYSMSVMGNETNTQIYNDGTYTYTLSNGEGTKKLNDASEQMPSLDELIGSIPQQIFTGLEFVEVENGYKISIAIPDEMILPEYNEMLSQAMQGYAESVSVSNIALDITINESGYIVQLDTGFDMALTIQEMDVTAHASICATLDNLGGTVTIIPPAGYQDFTEI